VNHHGRGLNEGHFTAVGKSEEHHCWMLFNDARVNVILEEKVLESQAYLLFYKRQKQQDD
jgi:ubiquitin C-terminal hydrolase